MKRYTYCPCCGCRLSLRQLLTGLFKRRKKQTFVPAFEIEFGTAKGGDIDG